MHQHQTTIQHHLFLRNVFLLFCIVKLCVAHRAYIVFTPGNQPVGPFVLLLFYVLLKKICKLAKCCAQTQISMQCVCTRTDARSGAVVLVHAKRKRFSVKFIEFSFFNLFSRSGRSFVQEMVYFWITFTLHIVRVRECGGWRQWQWCESHKIIIIFSRQIFVSICECVDVWCGRDFP